VVNLLEALYVVTALAAVIAALAWLQSRGGGDRAERYRRRMRRFLTLALALAVLCASLYWYLGAR
jgi:hypothetical protein